MAKISSYNFGFIVIDGKQYLHDVVILPDGAVKEREPGRGRLGSHNITAAEIERLQQLQPEFIIIGNGASGMARLSEDAKDSLRGPDSNIQLLPSLRAVQKFNQLVDEGKRVAALIHVTC